MPEISSLLSSSFFEIHLSGLMASLLVGPPKRVKFLACISERIQVLMGLFQIIEKIPTFSVKLGYTPFLYNSAMWSRHDVLGGYCANTVNIGLTELAVSYFAAWKFEGLYSRLIKAVLSYIRSGRTFAEGFRYLIDLFESGFVINLNEFISATRILLELYAKCADPLDAIKKIAIEMNPETTQEMIRSIKAIVRKPAMDSEKIREIFGLLLNEAFSKLENAKNIQSIGELLLDWAKLNGLLLVIQDIERNYKTVLRLGITDEALLSPLEELRADIGSLVYRLLLYPRYFPFTDIPRDKFPIPLNFLYFFQILIEYKKTYNVDAVKKMVQDRYVPGYFTDILNEISGEKEPPKDDRRTWSDKAVYLPVTFAFPLSCIKDAKPTMMRMELLPKDLFANEIKASFGTTTFSKKEINYLFDEQYSSMFQESEVEEKSNRSSRSQKTSEKKDSATGITKDDLYDLHIRACAKELEAKLKPLQEGADTMDKIVLQ